MASAACRTIQVVLLLPTILFVLGCVLVVYQTKKQVDVVQAAVPKELVLPSFEEIRAFAEGTHDLLDARFSAWTSAYNKQYGSESERKKRLGLYAASARLVEAHNSKIPANSDRYRLGLNEFADLSDAEFFAMFGLGKMKGQEDCSATKKNMMRKP